MRYLAIGDIHGCFNAFTTLVDYVKIETGDILITLGDYVDRGSNSRGVMEWLINFKSQGNLIALRGNHEIMMLESRYHKNYCKGWFFCGGIETLKSYCPNEENITFDHVPPNHWKFLEDTLPYYEIDTHFFVHANAYHNLPLNQQTEQMLFWEKLYHVEPHQSGKIMVCGHTSQKDGEPLNLKHTICIDTYAYGGQWLTCLDVCSGQFWQANENGETRTDYLS